MPIYISTESGLLRAAPYIVNSKGELEPIPQIYAARTGESLEPLFAASDFEWSLGEWGDCSATCGGGVQNREVVCKSIATGAEIDDAFCLYSIGEKPETQQTCNNESCSSCIYQRSGTTFTYTWVTKEDQGSSEVWYNGELVATGTYGQPVVNIDGVTLARGVQRETMEDPDNPGVYWSLYEVCTGAVERECLALSYSFPSTSLRTGVGGSYQWATGQQYYFTWNGVRIGRGSSYNDVLYAGGYRYTANTSGPYFNQLISGDYGGVYMRGYGICREPFKLP